MAEATVRRATVDDVAGIRRVADRGWNAVYGDLLSEDAVDAALAEWYDPETAQELVQRDDVACFVAVDEEVVGYVSGGSADDPGVATLGAIYVAPSRWGEGVGSALLSRFESWCLERDLEVVEFQVLTGNDVGRSFYRARGYEAVEAVETELFGDPVEELRFRGRIDPGA